MALQVDVTVQNARLDAIETQIGASPTMKMRAGSAPANCAAADSGTVLATLPLPSDWMAAASGGSKSMSGTWQDPAADAAGTLGHFRIYDSGGTCRLQGSITNTGGGGDLQVQNVSVQPGQTITVTAFTINDNNG